MELTEYNKKIIITTLESLHKVIYKRKDMYRKDIIIFFEELIKEYKKKDQFNSEIENKIYNYLDMELWK